MKRALRAVTGAKSRPSAMTVPRLMMKQALKITFPNCVRFKLSSRSAAYTTVMEVAERATPASRLAQGSHPRRKRAAHAALGNGAPNPTRSRAGLSRHRLRKASGSSSATARKVRTTEPAPARSVAQTSWVPWRGTSLSCPGVPAPQYLRRSR